MTREDMEYYRNQLRWHVSQAENCAEQLRIPLNSGVEEVQRIAAVATVHAQAAVAIGAVLAAAAGGVL